MSASFMREEAGESMKQEGESIKRGVCPAGGEVGEWEKAKC